MFADEGHSRVERRARAKDSSDSGCLERLDVLLRDCAAENNQDVGSLPFLKQRKDARNDDIVRAGQDAEPDAVHVLLDGGIDDHLRRLSQTGIDDLHAGVAKCSCDYFRAAVMAVEARLGNQHADRWFAAGW